jgi:hypothetical protein
MGSSGSINGGAGVAGGGSAMGVVDGAEGAAAYAESAPCEWRTAPYLHDGSAAMHMDVFRIHRDDQHGMTSQLRVVARSEPKVGSCQPRVRAKRSSRSRPFSILARLVA